MLTYVKQLEKQDNKKNSLMVLHDTIEKALINCKILMHILETFFMLKLANGLSFGVLW